MLQRVALALVCLTGCDRVFDLEDVQLGDAGDGVDTLRVSRRPGGWTARDLTEQGTLDWVHWGLDTQAGALNRKAGVEPLITDVMNVRGTLTANSVSALGELSWTDGTPTSMTTDAHDFLQLESSRPSGDGLELQVSAGADLRTATLYAGSYCVDTKLEVKLGALVEAVTSSDDLEGASYTIEFASAAGGMLTLDYTIEMNRCQTANTGELWLVAVTVAATP